MKFYNRDDELKDLDILLQRSKHESQMTVITGRRRLGKTLLALHVFESHKYLYFFVSKKSEGLLCEEYLEEIKMKFDTPIIGTISTFIQIFNLVLTLAEKENFTVIIDEFQEFYNINPSVYSDIQKLWDLNKYKCRLNLLFIGSVYSLMHKIFENSDEPLFGRANKIMKLKAFKINTLCTILKDHDIFSDISLFSYYIFTGGTPKYIDLLISDKAKDYTTILDCILRLNSPFLNEGKLVLIEEFGKEYSIYFSILQLISSGKTSRGEIESILQKNIGGYLERLMEDYAIIEKHNPVDANENTKLQKYKMVDNFLTFWFRFIYKNYSAIENENFEYVRKVIDRDYQTYCGKILEKFYHELFWLTKQYNRIGSYWEKGNQNEIDMVAINDFEKKCVIADIKLNKSKININQLKQKSKKLITRYKDYEVDWIGLSLLDINTQLEKVFK
jgi:AAA+ ATPase superfamily predicted ATPase